MPTFLVYGSLSSFEVELELSFRSEFRCYRSSNQWM